MKKINRLSAPSLALLGGMLLCFMPLFSGCETDSPDEAQITITPDFAHIKDGQSITLTASGWYRYQWSLSDSSIGRLSATTGNSVSYLALAPEGTQTIIASAVGDQPTTSSSGSGSNSLPAVVSATTIAAGTATILHK